MSNLDRIALFILIAAIFLLSCSVIFTNAIHQRDVENCARWHEWMRVEQENNEKWLQWLKKHEQGIEWASKQQEATP